MTTISKTAPEPAVALSAKKILAELTATDGLSASKPGYWAIRYFDQALGRISTRRVYQALGKAVDDVVKLSGSEAISSIWLWPPGESQIDHHLWAWHREKAMETTTPTPPKNRSEETMHDAIESLPTRAWRRLLNKASGGMPCSMTPADLLEWCTARRSEITSIPDEFGFLENNIDFLDFISAD